MKTVLFIAFLALLVSAKRNPFRHEDYEAGLMQLNEEDEMFYWLMRSRNTPEFDPLVLWLTGGPGCGAQMAIFYQNGPWYINDDLSLSKNPYSWNEAANVLYVDQPLGSGFSNTTNPDNRAMNQDDVAKTFYEFLLKFIEKYPEYKKRNFYVTGESYAGHYVPAITAYILEQENPDIRLVATAIGNGWVNAKIQYPQYRHFSLEHNLIEGTLENWYYMFHFSVCQLLIFFDFRLTAFRYCEATMNEIPGTPRSFNIFDIRKECIGPVCYEFDNVVKLMNLPEVRKAINMDDRPFDLCDGQVFKEMKGDQVSSFIPHVKEILDHDVGVFVYSGDKDYICNWKGGEAWTNRVFWSKQDEFRTARYNRWVVNGEIAGEYKRSGKLTFMKVFDAGHMVPMDQPVRALEMFKSFIARDFFYPELEDDSE